MKRILLICSVAFLALGVLSATKAVTEMIDLTSKGIPVTVDAPSGALITDGYLNEVESDGVYHSWEVYKDGFSLEVSMDDDELYQAPIDYVNVWKEILEDEYFDEYLVDEENGFIYQFTLDGEVLYGCYFLLVKNGRAIEFMDGAHTDHADLATVREIYAAAKGAR